jgi:hypothetical protein
MDDAIFRLIDWAMTKNRKEGSRAAVTATVIDVVQGYTW